MKPDTETKSKGLPGRPKGSVSAKTLLGREAIASFVEGNAWRLERWLEGIAKDNPKAAFDAFMSVCEYHLPKQARIEHTGKDGVNLFPQLTDEQLINRIQTLIDKSKGTKQEPILIEQSQSIDDEKV